MLAATILLILKVKRKIAVENNSAHKEGKKCLSANILMPTRKKGKNFGQTTMPIRKREKKRIFDHLLQCPQGGKKHLLVHITMHLGIFNHNIHKDHIVACARV